MLKKAYLTRKDNPNSEVPCQFNPNEINVEKGNQFAEINIPGLSTPVLQFVHGNARTLTLDLFFDTYESGQDVRQFTDRITGWDAGSMFSKLPKPPKGLMDIDSELHAPPVCLFIWGDYIFQCIIERSTKKFTMFLPTGIPVRATVNVTLKEYKEIKTQVKELDLHSTDLTKQRRIIEGDTLWAIAALEYGDPAQWRLIAAANDIDNPRRLEVGSVLVLPVKDK